VYYLVQDELDRIHKRIQGSTVKHLSSRDLAQALIPVPSLAIQAEIVRILDAFTAHTAELTAELTARKKQYNYYRDKLLSFEDGEVEWKPLGDENVGRFVRGGGLQKKDFTETGVGCIHYGQIYTHYGTFADKTKTFVSELFAKKAKMARTGNLVIATTSENDEDVCKAVAWLGCEEIAVSSDACIYKHKLDPKYVSYFFQTEHFQKQKRPFITGTKVRRVNADNLAKILIPVPVFEEQVRIANILDKFDAITNSITEGLPREIELRQKQYEYYRDLLLSFPKPEEEAA
jgi:type I restriction enzyme S subunit